MWKIIIFTIATGGITGEHNEQYISKSQCRKAAKKLDSDRKKEERDRLKTWRVMKKEYNDNRQEIERQRREWAELDSNAKTLDEAFSEAWDKHKQCAKTYERNWDEQQLERCKTHWQNQKDQRGKAYRDLIYSDRYKNLQKAVKAYKDAEKFLKTKPSGKPTEGYKCIKAN